MVRVYRAGWRSPSEIIYELELLTHLSARGVAVAAPSRTKDDRLVHTLPAPEGERQVAVFAYVEAGPCRGPIAATASSPGAWPPRCIAARTTSPLVITVLA